MRRWGMLATIALAILLAANAEAGKGKRCKDEGSRCSSSAQCCGGSCCSGRCCAGTCSTDGTCCNAFGGEVACGSSCCDTLLGEACCTQEPYGQLCLDTTSNNRNCGGCGIECRGGQTCDDGVCSCGTEATLCNGLCVDTLTDPDNCGSCNHSCPSGGTCVDGQCTCSGFNKGCRFDEQCQNGTCVQVCPQPTPGSAIDGTFVACDDGQGGYFCGCNGCGQVCGFPTACCHCDCIYFSTTCAEFCPH